MQRIIALFFLLYLGLAPARLAAQADTACTYDTCALRVKREWSAWRLVRGTEGQAVATLGTGQPLTLIVQGSERATVHARIYEQNNRKSLPFMLAGTVVLTAAPLAYLAGSDEALVIATVSGSALQWYGSYWQGKAQRALADALWWYNRDLPR